MPLLRAKKPNIYHKTHRSGNVSWCVGIGRKANGRADIRNFPTRAEAENFFNEWNLRLVEKSPHGLSDLSSIQRHDILSAVEKLEKFGATVTEAADFFLKFARPPKGAITAEEGLKLFLEKKAKAKRSQKYLTTCENTFFGPFAKAFPNRVVNQITAQEVETYIHSHKNWNPVTTKSHINYLSTFFEFLIDQKYALLNPLDSLDRPKKAHAAAKALTVDNATKLLQFALDNGLKQECAAMTLVFFCGVRVEEVNRLTWGDINFETSKVTVPMDAAKTDKRRVNPIPANAVEWLRLCKSQGAVAPDNYDKRMQRLRKKSGIKYPQNAMRHSFCGYHLAEWQDAVKTAFLLSHPNPKLLYATYYELVSKEDAARYWQIVPKSVADAREAAKLAKASAEEAERIAQESATDAKRRAEEATRLVQERERNDREREEAQAESNCGIAEQGDDGKWFPVMQVEDERLERAAEKAKKSVKKPRKAVR